MFTAKDGGPNDSDEQANGSITMALGTLIEVEMEPRALTESRSVGGPTEKSGGGIISSLLLLLFAALALGLRHNAPSRARQS